MSLVRSLLRKAQAGFPRVSGDEPDIATDIEAAAMFSPRERG